MSLEQALVLFLRHKECKMLNRGQGHTCQQGMWCRLWQVDQKLFLRGRGHSQSKV
jgi:hypothetical protein